MSKSIKAENGYRIIGGALMIKKGDRAYSGGKWDEVTGSIGMTVAEAKSKYPKSVWARKISTEVEKGDNAIPFIPVVPGAKKNKVVVQAGPTPKGYAELPFGQIKMNGDIYFSDTGEWKPVVKSLGKIYKVGSLNKVARQVAKTIGAVKANVPYITNEIVPNVPKVVTGPNRFTLNQKVEILNTHGNKTYHGKKGKIVFFRQSKKSAGLSYFVDLDNSPQKDNDVINVRGDFLKEA